MESRFVIGEGYALYQGPSGDGSFHRHAAFQVAIAVRGAVTVVDASGVSHRDVALVVAPMARHRLLATDALRTFFVDPHCAFADRLRRCCDAGVVAAPSLRDLTQADVHHAAVRPSDALDLRLMAAMDALADGRPASMPEIAASVGLSSQRLRALARHGLGMPLPRWRIWHRLRRAAEAVQEGRPLAEAAIAGGFADQAHFTRQMREMVGLTPAAVLPMLRRSGPVPGVDRDRTGDR
ncbi:AraC family transcriptional regulator [Actinomadura sp. DC4]|uniref:helix-turn-helix domain-containing protein n=1 Tax=Actinomadura sp. DC4 TaxID=3055069 RepID=UPI0025B12646|nr:AraC family transcriptional regulator [Actinomadura sp. DC4]MDN3353623.1 AraC family transcriptional regulator [Actinomadura sp. DC4]